MNWHNVSKREPCPICHKTDWCNLSNDGAVCICHRVESPRLAPSGSGWIHRLIDRPFTPYRRGLRDRRWQTSPASDATLAFSDQTAEPQPQLDATLAFSDCGVARAEQDRKIPSAGVVATSENAKFCVCEASAFKPATSENAKSAYRASDLRSASEQEPTIHCSPSPSTFTYTLDFQKIHASYSTDPILIEGLATTLGVDDLALKSLDVRFNRFDECWSFPMRDAEGRIVGLRYRELAGSKKWSARGSKDGLFYSTVHLHLSPSPKELIIVEGPSDTAAAMSLFAEDEPSTESSCGVGATEPPSTPPSDATLAFSVRGVARAEQNRKIPSAGVVATTENAKFCVCEASAFKPATSENANSAYRASDLRSNLSAPTTNHQPPITYLPVGRSSCQTGSQHLSALIRRVRPTRITIVADNDAPGIKGAELLAQQITNHQSLITNHLPVRILIVPAPYKDLRAWYLSNTLTQRLFTDLASAQRWR